jgi:hypothetical protein
MHLGTTIGTRPLKRFGALSPATENGYLAGRRRMNQQWRSTQQRKRIQLQPKTPSPYFESPPRAIRQAE